jgi:peptide/nickel transport system ATP-binding protein
MGDPLLAVEDLRTVFHTDDGPVRAVDGVSFDIEAGETLGLVGESGSGKTVTARSIVGLVEGNGDVSGSVRYRGEELVGKPESELQSVRGGEIGMVFQDSLASLDPVYTVGNQLKESLRYQRGLTGEAAEREAIELLEDVGIPDAPRRLDSYPHELSGGQRQRALIALALACEPALLVCDEPTTGLDVSTQANLLTLLEEIQASRGLAILFITHDLGVIAQTADRVNVMYAGEIVESAPVGELFDAPAHPYTRGLLASVPSARDSVELNPIPGEVPTPTAEATSCRFAPRCPEATAECEAVHPERVDVGEDHTAACLLYPESLARDEAAAYHAEGEHPNETGDSPNGTGDSPNGTDERERDPTGVTR